MGIKKEEPRTCYLWDTPVENLFICEYMPDAPGEYVKVYLYGLMEAGKGNSPTTEELAKALGMSVSEVEKAFLYFEEARLLKKQDGDTIYISMKEQLYGTKQKQQTKAMSDENLRSILDNRPLKELFDQVERQTGRFITTTETEAIISWLKDYGATCQVIAGAYSYCGEKGKTNYKYVDTVVKDWVSKGLKTKEDVENHLGEGDKRHYTYGRVMKALGFHRIATEEEKRIIDLWLDQMNCSMADILEACGKTAGIPNPNINYVNAVLKNNKGTKQKGPSRKTVMDRYQEIRDAESIRMAAAKEEIYQIVPEIRSIDEELANISMEMTKVMISGGKDKGQRLKDIKGRVATVERKRDMLLTQHNIPIDYASQKYLCSSCKDTGTMEDGQRCRCYLERAREVEETASP